MNSFQDVRFALCPFQGCLPQLRRPSGLQKTISRHDLRVKNIISIFREEDRCGSRCLLPLVPCTVQLRRISCRTSFVWMDPPHHFSESAHHNCVGRLLIHPHSRYLVLAGKSNQQCYQSPLREIHERSPSHRSAERIGN